MTAQIATLRELAKPGLLERGERFFRPHMGETAPSASNAHADEVRRAEQASLHQQYGLDPKLFGSMSTGLNVPGDVDIDMFTHVPDKEKFLHAVSALQQSGKYRSSSLNVPGAGLQVFKRDAAGADDFPIDVVLGHGADSEAFSKQIDERQQAAAALPEDIRQAIVDRKRYFRHTAFDPGKKRYTSFKQHLDFALTPHPSVLLQRDKVARILGAADPELTKYLQGDDLFGHRTTAADSVLNDGRILAGLTAFQDGKLKDYESGDFAGHRTPLAAPDLSPEELKALEGHLLSAAPNHAAVKAMAAQHGGTEATLTAALLKGRGDATRRFLRTQADPEAFRKEHLAIPKLGPSIFLTHGGLLNTDSYGDTGFLLHTNRAKSSPYANLIPGEHIIQPKSALGRNSVSIRNALVVAPRHKIDALNTAHPEYRYVAMEDLPDEKKLPLYSPKEMLTRWAPHIAKGDFSIQQTR